MNRVKHQLSSFRFRSIQSQMHTMFLVLILLLATLLSIYVLMEPSWLTVGAIFLFIGLYTVFMFFTVLFVGFRVGAGMTHRLRSLSLMITHFANGDYEARAHDFSGEQDELSRVFTEMNELGEKMQTQVRSLKRLAEENSELAQMSHKTAVIEERQRFARDLHDSVSQQLFALSMMAEAAVKQLEKKPELAKKQMEDVAQAAHHAQAEMRALLLHLRPVYLAGETLVEGIEKLAEEIKVRNAIDFQMEMPAEMTLPDVVEEHIFRMVQEALSNILRHAEASVVKLRLQSQAGDLYVHISDNGKGFEMERQGEKKTSLGLQTMRERAEELGGTFAIRSLVGEGTYIDIRIPIKEVE